MAKRKNRKPQAKRRNWKKRFLDELATTGNVRLACERAGVERTTVYRARWDAEAARPPTEPAADSAAPPRQYDDFAGEWDRAIADACDRLEQEAWRRGMSGVDEPVFYQGEMVATIRRYSDGLLTLLLKAHKPEKYRERFEHTGPDGIPLAIGQTVIYIPDNGRNPTSTPSGSTGTLPIQPG